MFQSHDRKSARGVGPSGVGIGPYPEAVLFVVTSPSPCLIVLNRQVTSWDAEGLVDFLLKNYRDFLCENLFKINAVVLTRKNKYNKRIALI